MRRDSYNQGFQGDMTDPYGTPAGQVCVVDSTQEAGERFVSIATKTHLRPRRCNARNTITAQLAIHSQERSVLFASARKAVFCMPLANGFHSMRNTCLSL